MHSLMQKTGKTVAKSMAIVLPMLVASYAPDSLAIPAFARQTGQNCVACHAGGQFPELTPYGRLFKLTGYTIGERTIPISAMAVVTSTKVRNRTEPNPDPATSVKADFPNQNGTPIFNTASVFLAGKITDNIGGFAQWTFNAYDHLDGDNNWKNKVMSDNADIRYADHFINNDRDLIVGLSFNNNPSVQDVWNSAPAWGFDLVPGSNPAGFPAKPQLAGGLAQQVVGIGAYAYWNKMVYAELSVYRTANNVWSFMSQGFEAGDGNLTRMAKNMPYARIALTKEWGAHNIMVGGMAMIPQIYNDNLVTTPGSPTTKYRDIGVDAQYQYLLAPHTVTAQMSYINERIHYDPTVSGQSGPYDTAMGTTSQPLTNTTDRLNLFRAKASYVYRATYGGSLSYYNLNGSYNSASQVGIPGDLNAAGSTFSNSSNVTGKPNTVAWIPEVFWIPVQNVRVGMQYSMFTKYQGASKNYDGWGRNARDNDALFLYIWGAY
jgi:hypothetical protein